VYSVKGEGTHTLFITSTAAQNQVECSFNDFQNLKHVTYLQVCFSFPAEQAHSYMQKPRR